MVDQIMYRLLIILFLLSQAMLSQPAYAQNEKFTVRGFGAQECGQAVADMDLAYSEGRYISWAQGYLSGMNAAWGAAGGNQLYLPQPKTTIAFVKKHCEDNPLDQVYQALNALFQELWGDSSKHHSQE